MVIFIVEDFVPDQFSRSMWLKVYESQIQHSFGRQMNPLKKYNYNLALYIVRLKSDSLNREVYK